MRPMFRQLVYRAVAAFSVLVCAWTCSEAQRLLWLDPLPGSYFNAARDVSADGLVVVGDALISWSEVRPVQWQDGAASDLGTLGGEFGVAWGVSEDGSIVAGMSTETFPFSYLRATCWQSGVIQDLGTLGGLRSAAYALSADGSVVVGWAEAPNERLRAFRWVQGQGLQDLGTLGGIDGYATAVSPDGSIVVGSAQNANFRRRAFRWRNGVMQDLGTLPGYNESEASGVSADGSVVVGVARNDNGQRRAFRWRDGVIRDLGTLGGRESSATGVSADGRVVVGWAQDASGRDRASRWIEGRGIEDLNQTYASFLDDGSLLQSATALSPDGRYIVGYGYNAATECACAFFLDTWRAGDTNGDDCINDTDLLKVLFAFGTAGTGYTRHEDIDKNGVVDDADLLTVLFNFGGGC
ncbi:MAG: HAF repeat-containing protein [Armatimonadota bacterium]|nr:HAF repeat-containing protein [Armatimonadota bacterium]